MEKDDLTPTPKSAEVEDALTEFAGISRQEAHEKMICTWCKEPLTEFRDELSRQEYRISGLCQKCQDETFGEEKEETTIVNNTRLFERQGL